MKKVNAHDQQEAGRVIAHLVKMHLERRGYSFENLPPDFPVSRRTLYNIQAGRFELATLRRLAGIVEVKPYFTVKIASDQGERLAGQIPQI